MPRLQSGRLDPRGGLDPPSMRRRRTSSVLSGLRPSAREWQAWVAGTSRSARHETWPRRPDEVVTTGPRLLETSARRHRAGAKTTEAKGERLRQLDFALPRDRHLPRSPSGLPGLVGSLPSLGVGVVTEQVSVARSINRRARSRATYPLRGITNRALPTMRYCANFRGPYPAHTYQRYRPGDSR